MIRRSISVGLRLLIIATLTTLSACNGAARHPIILENQEDAEDFHNFLVSYLKTVDDMLHQVRKGETISDFSAGMLAYNILTTLSSADDELHAHITAGGQDVQAYLRTRFQDDPDKEIAAIAAINQHGASPLRSSARYALEMLTYVPNTSDPISLQQQNRDQLGTALEKLKSSLAETDKEIKAPQP
jgi:hypothetical protein